MYLVSVDAREWCRAGEGGWGEVATALREELRCRGLPPWSAVPARSGDWVPFEEKMSPPMEGFDRLCRAHLTPEEAEVLGGWTVLVPPALPGLVHLPVASAFAEETTVAGAPQVLGLAERLAQVVELPEETPRRCVNLDLTRWFMDGPARQLAGARPGAWSDDLDTAFYVALYLRAAQHALRQRCPLVYS